MRRRSRPIRGNWELRLHYVELLLGAAQATAALQQATIVLAGRPDDA